MNCYHQRAYFSSPGDMWAWRAMVMMMMAAGEKRLTRPTELSGNPTNSYRVGK
jgi:hypothetical protein